MQLRLPSDIRPLAGNGSLTLESGFLAGIPYRLELQICANPFCNCSEMEFRCTPEKLTDSAPPVEPISLKMDFQKRKIIVTGPEGRNSARELGQALIQEIAPFHWNLMTERFLKVKNQITQKEDLTKFTPRFSEETLLHTDYMVSYHEILPFAARLDVILEGQVWALDEQYCLRERCACHESSIAFIRIDQPVAGRRPKPVTLNVRYDFSTGIFTGESPAPRQKRLLNMLCINLREKYPDLNAILTKHRDRLARLLEHAKALVKPQSKPSPAPSFATPVPTPAFNAVPVPQASSSKPGRNDPCPCGSGKKYKKCCGR